jgi:hypothetical protein
MTALQKWLMSRIFICLALASGATQVLALDCESAPVPYSANYSVNRDEDPDGSMHVVLQRNSEDHFSYRMETRVKWGIFTAYIEEQSDFRWQDGVVLPDSFKLTQKVSLYKRRDSVEFDWQSMKATGTRKRADFKVDIIPGMQDKLSVYLLLAGSLCRGEYSIDAAVVSGPEPKTYKYQFQAIEPLDTVLGRVQTIHIRRGVAGDEKQTDLWHAEEAHFLPVKMIYRDDDIITDMRLIDISFNDG